MKHLVFIIVIMFVASIANGQSADNFTIRYQINKPYCLLNFMETLLTKGYYGPSLYEYFKQSKFADDKQLKELVEQYRRLKIKYSYEFKNYPKYRFMAKGRSTRDLYYMLSAKTETLNEFKQITAGLIPYYIHQQLFDIFKAVEPIYDELIWIPYHKAAYMRLAGLEDYSSKVKLDEKLKSIATLFNSAWSPEIPIIVSFAIVPGDKIKRLPPPQSNVIFCNILTDSKDYSRYAGMVAHEFAHRAFTEQSLSSHQQLDRWLTGSTLPSRFMVNFMFNEVMGGAVGHKIQEDLIGAHEFSYGQSYIKSFDVAIYPLVKSYLESEKTIDSVFVQQSLLIYDKTFPNAQREYHYLLQTYYLVTDAEDFPLHRLPELIARNINNPMMYEIGSPIQDSSTIQAMMDYDFTKLLVVTKNHRETFEYLKTKIEELDQFSNLDYDSDFILSFHDALGRAYIIMNLQSIDNFESALQTLKTHESIDLYEPIVAMYSKVD
ncbi:hypothetical protein JW935_26700 [candidate division KSB1 bacterium]|nr:hypothetical protein [candidate division KSB1 bacterium]